MAGGGGEGIRLNIFGGDADVIVNFATKRGGISGGPKIPGRGGSVSGGATGPPPPSLIAVAVTGGGGGTGWYYENDECKWYGVDCYRNDNRDDDDGDLVDLERLYLGNNRLGGTGDGSSQTIE